MMKKRIFKKVYFTCAAIALLIFLSFAGLTPNRPFSPEKSFARDETVEHDDKLQAESDALLPLFEDMPPVAVFIKDAPVIKTGSSVESGVAYTECAEHVRPTVYIKRIFYDKANRKQLINILKHELTHAWLCRQQLMSGHDERFRQKFAAVGGFGN